MHISPGTILISTPSTDDPNFEQVVILIAEHNATGAMGFVVNHLFPRKFNELQEFKHSPAFSLYAGGPVKTEQLFFIHRKPDLIGESIPVSGPVYLGGNFQDTVMLINSKQLSEADVRMFIGYCGWNDKELEAEIEAGSWQVSTEPAACVFLTDTASFWNEISGRINHSS